MKSLACKVGILATVLFLILPVDVFGLVISGDTYDSKRILVKFKKFPSQKQLEKFAASHGLRLERALPRIDVFRFRISGGGEVQGVLERFAANRLIEFAEPDYVRLPAYEPNDPLFPSQWDMTLIGLPACWDLEKGRPEVVTAVLDTGMDLDHPDLVNQRWVNSDEIAGNRVDDDGNGYVDDRNGYDFAGDGVFPLPWGEDSIPEDLYVGHGTHVSGTIAARQDNAVGISGEAPGTRLMTVRVLGGIAGSGFSSDIAEGIIYAADNGANIINMSLGGTAKSLTEYNALKYAWDNNVFIAAAAGNEGDSGNPISYPAAYVFAMSVGATDSSDNIAGFSTHNEFVEISAPGVNILSTVRGGSYESGWSGTSMATPHVAGLAALLCSIYSDIENWQVRWLLQSGVIDLGASGWDEFFGYGRADCDPLLAAPLPSDDALNIITPPSGVRFRSGALVAVLWNPVAGAVSYRITATLPTGGTKVINTTDPYYTVPPSQSMPSGTYSVKVQALKAGGAVISSDTFSFKR